MDHPAAGILNIGNTCYLNTALQCLGHCASFRKLFIDKNYPHEKEFFNHMKNIYKLQCQPNSSGVVNPVEFARSLQKTLKIHICEQNDITEFLSLLLDKLNTEISVNAKDRMLTIVENTEYADTSYERQRKKMDIDWCEKIGKEYSDIVPMLYGQQISQIICNSCNKIWHNYEVYQQISVAIPNRNTNHPNHHPQTPSITSCIIKHFEDMQLGEWKCDKCGKGQGSSQTALLWRNPKILIVSLKRFEFDPRSGNFVKNNTPVNVPHTLDLSSKTIGKTKKSYHLKSVAFHSGSYHGGHYHAICINTDGTCYGYDDETVHTLSAAPNNIGQGYVFFYESA